MSETDVIIVGGGHNGLTTAAYLAKSGLSVQLLERSSNIGGACITEETYSGYKYSTAAYVTGMLRPEVKDELTLYAFGLEEYPFDPANFVPYPDGRHLFFWNDIHKTSDEITKFSKKDAKSYLEYVKFWDDFSELVEPTLTTPPPPLSNLMSLFEGSNFEEFAKKVILSSIKEFLDEYFESEELKGPLANVAVSGTDSGPRTPGTTFVLGYKLMSDIHGKKGVGGYTKGGMGGITKALEKAAIHYGVRIRTDSEVSNIIVTDGKAKGVELKNGEKLLAKIVVSNADPKTTFLRLLQPEFLDTNFRRKVERIKTEGGSGIKLNIATSELPDFKSYPGRTLGPQHGRFVICPSLDYLEKSWDDFKYGAPSERPRIDGYIHTAHDPSMAPPGKHVISIFTVYAPYKLKNGKSWDDIRDEEAEKIIDIMTEYAPNFKRSILHKEVLTPLDMERKFGMTEGNIHHVNLTFDQMLSMRPLPGWSNYKTPIEGLYLCGSGTHPGGGVTGAPGRNCATVILGDLKIENPVSGTYQSRAR